jgi:hypothetical protein
MYEYWIGKGVDYDRLWKAYDEGQPYIQKYQSMRVHLIQISFEQQSSSLPMFNCEAILKTVKGYFHDLKHICLTTDEYQTAGPLFVYSIDRSSEIWAFLGELRQLLLFGTTLSDQQTIGHKLDNIDKKLEILKKHFGTDVNPEDFQRFMKAKTPRQIEGAFQHLIEQGIKKVEISQEPFSGNIEETKTKLVDIKKLLNEVSDDKKTDS